VCASVSASAVRLSARGPCVCACVRASRSATRPPCPRRLAAPRSNALPLPGPRRARRTVRTNWFCLARAREQYSKWKDELPVKSEAAIRGQLKVGGKCSPPPTPLLPCPLHTLSLSLCRARTHLPPTCTAILRHRPRKNYVIRRKDRPIRVYVSRKGTRV
jgi:hypothetical protein